eukprot:scaffold1472_cov300-Pinguiococcus_pyrenoidosus.AAC.8
MAKSKSFTPPNCKTWIYAELGERRCKHSTAKESRRRPRSNGAVNEYGTQSELSKLESGSPVNRCSNRDDGVLAHVRSLQKLGRLSNEKKALVLSKPLDLEGPDIFFVASKTTDHVADAPEGHSGVAVDKKLATTLAEKE